MAIHDAAYATPPQTWQQFKWRLQHLAEERLGVAKRSAAVAEEEAVRRMNDAR